MQNVDERTRDLNLPPGTLDYMYEMLMEAKDVYDVPLILQSMMMELMEEGEHVNVIEEIFMALQ